MMFLACAAITIQSTNAKNPEPQPIEAEDIKIEIVGLKVETINYQDTYPNLPKFGSGKRMEWGMIAVAYEWELTSKGEKKHKASKAEDRNYYLDNLEFDWKVVLAQPEDGRSVKPTRKGFNISEEKSVRMREKVRYVNVSSDEKRHYALVFLEPRAISRYLNKFYPNKVFIDLSIKLRGQQVLRMTALGENFAQVTPETKRPEKELDKYVPRQTSRDVSMHLSERVETLEGVLRSKDETPWQWSQLDTFDTIDSSQKE